MKALLLLCFFVIVKSMAWSQTATAPASGNGTRGNPYRIASLENLYWLSQNSAQWGAGKYYIQTADIDASSTSTWFSNGAGGYYGFPCIGGYSQSVGNQVTGSFAATYDGQGFSISNLYINRSPHFVALFGYTNNASIRNLRLINPTVLVGATGGSISTGYSGNAILVASGTLTLDNVHVTGATLTVNSWHGYIGGMLGRMGSVTASNSSIQVTMSITTTYGGSSGGFFALMESGTSVFTNCYSSGSLTSTTVSFCGGFVGASYMGSFTYQRCGSSMNVSVPNYAGGFMGQLYDGTNTFNNCYATGNVSGNNSGGFVSYNNSGASTFTNCYATGSVSGTNSGGFGTAPGSHLFSNCFWDNQTSGKSNGFGSSSNVNVTGKTTAEMKTLSTFTGAGWDFHGESVNGTNDYWIVDGGYNNGYPAHPGKIRVWNGTVNTDWTNPANWNLGIVPSATSIVQIMSGATKLPSILSDISLDRFDFNGMSHLLDLGGSNLTCNQVLNYGSNRFIKTSGNGRLLINITNSDMRVFPVGNSALNTAFITNNTGGSDVFGIRVLDDVYANGSSAPAVSVNRIGRTWDISKNNANGGSGINLVLNWNSGEEVGTMSSPALYHYAAGWQKQTGTTASTATSLSYTGYTGSFSPFAVVDGASTLPVTWLSFTGQRKGTDVLLNWRTGTEEQTGHFTVQHSSNGNSWTNLGEVAAAGNTTEARGYSFVHAQAPANSNLYRILVTDIGGKTSYSKVITVLMPVTMEPAYRLYPIPLRQQPLIVETKAAGEARLRTLGGTIVWKALLPEGRTEIRLPKLSAGTYLFTLGHETRQVLIQ